MQVQEAQHALMADLDGLADADLAAPSRCEGWTRGHVLSHVARNADALVNLCRWALTGDPTPMYPSQESRNADIAAGAERGIDEIVADLEATNERLLDAMGEVEGAVAVDPSVAARDLRLGDLETGRVVPARDLPWLRLQEVQVHHLDLDLGLRPQDWMPAWVAAGLPRVWRRMAGRLDDPPRLVVRGPTGDDVIDPAGSGATIVGTAPDLLVWLLGRSDADQRARLSVEGGGDLPALPAY
ncbi:maleylpyruvate isomerase family mycothiol-dependent enzyme [Salsipaludibacter albus]|uniref:maleylpyruvate isomerase family mycothiol-dependent enzyme n=1 Tax=Salsipaludibacter albus TaxID=2849650 RepID=UPI003B75BF7B